MRKFEGITQNAIDTTAGKYRFLNDDFMLCTFIHSTAERGIFAFGVFPDHVKIDVARLFSRQRAGNARKETNRAQVDVLVEFTTKFQQRTPQRNMVRNGIRPADGTKIDGVETAKLLMPVVRHHFTVMAVILAARPLHLLKTQGEAPALSGSL